MNRFCILAVVALTFGCIPAGDSVDFQADGTPNNTNNLNNANNVNNVNNVNNANNVNNVNNVSDASTPDTGSDMGSAPDMSQPGEDMSQMNEEMCVPLSESELCMANAIECGTTSVQDNCGANRDITCGACADGAGCEQGTCLERDCRDNVDNDGDGLTNCEDSDCNGRRCSQRPMDRCRGNGTCG